MVHDEIEVCKMNAWVYQVPNQAPGQRRRLRNVERSIDRKALYETRRNRKARVIAERRDRKHREGRAEAWDGGWVAPFVCVCVACVLVFRSL